MSSLLPVDHIRERILGRSTRVVPKTLTLTDLRFALYPVLVLKGCLFATVVCVQGKYAGTST